MNVVAATHHIAGPHVDWTALSPIVVLAVAAWSFCSSACCAPL